MMFHKRNSIITSRKMEIVPVRVWVYGCMRVCVFYRGGGWVAYFFVFLCLIHIIIAFQSSLVLNKSVVSMRMIPNSDLLYGVVLFLIEE